MKYLLIIALLSVIGCSSSSEKSEETVTKLPNSVNNFFNEDFKNFEINLNTKKILSFSENTDESYFHHIRFSAGDKSFELPIAISFLDSSQTKDCEFSDLLITFKPGTTAGTPFYNTSSLELHNYCQNSIFEKNVNSSNRKIQLEEIIYAFQDILGFPEVKNKTLEITYIDAQKKSTSRKRLNIILENKSSFSSRFSAEFINDNKIKHDNKIFMHLLSRTDRDQALKIHLFNALIADRNYQFPISDLEEKFAFNPTTGYEFKNLAFLNTKKKSLLLVGDVSKSKFINLEDKKLPKVIQEKTACLDYFCVTQFEIIQKWRSFYTKKEFDHAISFYEKFKQQLENTVIRSTLPEKDKQLATAMINFFYQQLWNYEKIPVILSQGTPIYRTSSLDDPCGKENDINLYVRAPAGLPAFVLEETDKAKRLLLFDTRDKSLTNPETLDSCVDSKENQNWVSKDVKIDANWPQK